MKNFYATIEAGGTKFNCAIIDQQRNVIQERRIQTTEPNQTLGSCIEFFKAQKKNGFNFNKLGLACFGPLDLNKTSSNFGFITKTPKPDWSYTPIVSVLSDALDCNVEVDTDVNAAALAESKWGASEGTQVSVYVTIGTGVGGGVVINGQTLKGLIHPEVGHMLVPAPKNIEGKCPFHGNCVEGFASGRAMSQIWGKPAEELEHDHPAWEIQAEVIAALCHNLMVAYSPEKIILGGGVMAKSGLLNRVILKAESSLAEYLCYPQGIDLSSLISLPKLGDKSGLMGALALVLEKY